MYLLFNVTTDYRFEAFFTYHFAIWYFCWNSLKIFGVGIAPFVYPYYVTGWATNPNKSVTKMFIKFTKKIYYSDTLIVEYIAYVSISFSIGLIVYSNVTFTLDVDIQLVLIWVLSNRYWYQYYF